MMKKVCISFLAGLSGLVLTGQVAANEGSIFQQGYVGVSYYHAKQDNRFFGDGERDSYFETGELFVRLVGNINEYFSSEMRLGTTIDANSDDLQPALAPTYGEEGEFRHDYIFSAFLRLGHRFGNVKPYVAGGYTWGRERFEPDEGSTLRETFDDFAMAAGIDIDLGDRMGINIEAVEYYEIGNIRLRGPGAGFYWRF